MVPQGHTITGLVQGVGPGREKNQLGGQCIPGGGQNGQGIRGTVTLDVAEMWL